MQIKAFCKEIYRYMLHKWNRFLYQEILVLGDSHASIFLNKNIKHAFLKYYFNAAIIGGATVSGLENPNSKTQALPLFRAHLKTSTAKKQLS